jgi:hypothetical protein
MSQSFEHNTDRQSELTEDPIPYKLFKRLGAVSFGAGVILDIVAVATGDAAIGWGGIVLTGFGISAGGGAYLGEKREQEDKDFQ